MQIYSTFIDLKPFIVLASVPRGCYAVMLPWNALHSPKSPKMPHVAHLERIAFPKRALLESWLQIRNVPCFSNCRGIS
jgi:hypothetical protein